MSLGVAARRGWEGSWRGPSTNPPALASTTGPSWQVLLCFGAAAWPMAARCLLLGTHLSLALGRSAQAWPGGMAKSPRLVARSPARPRAGWGAQGVLAGDASPGECSGIRLCLGTLG